MQLDIAKWSTDNIGKLFVSVPLVDELEVLRLLGLGHSYVDFLNHRVELSNVLQFRLVEGVERSLQAEHFEGFYA